MDLKSWLNMMPRGETARLATKLGVTPQTIYDWRDSTSVPAHWVLSIWVATSGKVHPYDLRPDIYPRGIVTFSLDALEINHPVPQRGRRRQKSRKS